MTGNAFMLMFVGMSVVFIFLVLLNLAMSLLAYCTREHTSREQAALAEEELARRSKKKKSIDTGDIGTQAAVISAAVHAFRST
ncbi:MAG: oxaloacetate decarboxylase gamma chain [Candidatus Scalindua arabica]|uniref:Oxaloacetate decarboxylase gamma chain n=1 Tax=Candidatus Scalindua arabica TaxID=1127984 RepID=A0A941W574_9BACT|nr:oxaloacetate decarboxylase gamma chain [Candidatus Scalindua arabica]